MHRVVVELADAGDPIRGSVRSDAGVWAFDGWMELTAALEDARRAMRSATRRSPGEPGESKQRSTR